MPNIQPHLAASLNIHVRMASAVSWVPATSCRLLSGNYSLEDVRRQRPIQFKFSQSIGILLGSNSTWRRGKRRQKKQGDRKKIKIYKLYHPKPRADVVLKQYVFQKPIRLEIFY